MIYDLPYFIRNELCSGPYGPYVGAYIAQVNSYYSQYLTGADFLLSEATEDGNDEHTVVKSRRIRRLIDKQAEFMLGNTPSITVSCLTDPATCENQDDIQHYLDAVLAANKFSSKLLKGGKDCFIAGRVLLCVDISPAGEIILHFVPANEFWAESDTDNVDRLGRVVLFYCINEEKDKDEQRWWRKRYRMENGHALVQESIYDGYGNIITAGEEQDTGLDRIPCCVIVNDGLSGDMLGLSDVDIVANEDSEYNKMRSENSDSLSKNMNPLAYIMGASPKTFKGLDRRPGAVNDIQPDPVLNGKLPEVGLLENSFNFQTSYKESLETVTAEMYDYLGIPDVRAAATSGLITSGKGLKALYWSLISRCNGKWSEWKPALEYMARIIIDAAGVYPDLKTRYGTFALEEYLITVEENYALPEDEEEERRLDLSEVGTARSVRSYMMRWGGPNHTGLSAEKAEEEIEQMAKERRMLSDFFEGEISGDTGGEGEA